MSDPTPDGSQHKGAMGPGRGTVVMLVARVVQLLSGFGVSIILARGLGPVEFGIYGVVMSLLTWLERLISAGVPAATANMMAREPSRHAAIEQSTRFLMVLYALPLFGVAWWCAPLLAERLAVPSGTVLIRIALLNLPVMGLYYAYEGIFGGRRTFALQSLLHSLQAVAKIVGIALLLFVGLSVAGAFVVHIIATVLTVLLIGLRYRVGGGPPSGALMWKTIQIAIPIGVYSVALAVLMNLSLWQLQSASADQPEAVGYFAAGLNLGRIMMMVPASVGGVLFASLAWAIANARQDLVTTYIQGAVRFAVIVTVPACVLIGANADNVMQLLYGTEYAAGGRVLAWLTLAFSMVAVCDVLLVALMAGGKRLLSAAVLLGLIPVMYLLNRSWIAVDGAVGAALASAVAFALGTIIAGVLTQFRLAVPLRLSTALRVAAAGFITWCASAVIPGPGLWLLVKLAGLGTLYLALLWVMNEITKDEVAHLAVWKAKQP